jgi:hypothetical protein
MAYLEKFICSDITDEARQLHANLQANDGNQFVNTSFEIEMKLTEEIDPVDFDGAFKDL